MYNALDYRSLGCDARLTRWTTNHAGLGLRVRYLIVWVRHRTTYHWAMV